MVKIRKILYFIPVFLFALAVMTVLPQKVSAEQISADFQSILNENGKLVVTDTTMSEDKLDFLQSYLQKYTTDSYRFIADAQIDETHYRISLFDAETNEYRECYGVEVIFEEKYSDEFKSILTDGKLEYINSSEHMTKDWLSSYVRSLGNANYGFGIDSYYDWDTMTNNILISDDCSKATIVMNEEDGSRAESHVIELVRKTERSDNFKNKLKLNTDGKLVVNSVKPTDNSEFAALYDMCIRIDGVELGYIAPDFTSCDLTVNDTYETHTVDIVYNYDKQIQEKLQGFVDDFPDDLQFFKVQDMELINYWVNLSKEQQEDINDTFPGYSGEFKKYLKNYNVKFEVVAGLGWEPILLTERVGRSLFKYNDIVYCIKNELGTRGKHIIYVPDNTGNSKEELMAAAQKRIDDYLGSEGKVTISYAGTVLDICLRNYYDIYQRETDDNMTFEEYKNSPFCPDDIDVEMETGLDCAENADCFVTTINGQKHYFLIEKNSANMITPTYATADMATDVTISSTDTSIPLDTSIMAEKITGGSEYDKIIKIIDVTNSETFDLKLYSETLEKYITKSNDGKFEVKIPISKELEGKKLVVYYVDENDKVTEHEVTVKDGYAIFTTDHFSIYTLAEAKATEESGSNPENGDNILYFAGILLIAAIGIVTVIRYRKFDMEK